MPRPGGGRRREGAERWTAHRTVRRSTQSSVYGKHAASRAREFAGGSDADADVGVVLHGLRRLVCASARPGGGVWIGEMDGWSGGRRRTLRMRLHDMLNGAQDVDFGRAEGTMS